METMARQRQNARRLGGYWRFCLSALDLMDAFTAQSFQPAVSREVIRESILKFTRNRYQQGSLRKVRRKSGAEVWEYRFRNHAEPGSPMRQITLSALVSNRTKALVRLQEDVLRINDSKAFKAHNRPTLGLVIDRFSTEERLEGILRQAPGEATITDGFPGAPPPVTAATSRSTSGPNGVALYSQTPDHSKSLNG